MYARLLFISTHIVLSTGTERLVFRQKFHQAVQKALNASKGNGSILKTAWIACAPDWFRDLQSYVKNYDVDISNVSASKTVQIYKHSNTSSSRIDLSREEVTIECSSPSVLCGYLGSRWWFHALANRLGRASYDSMVAYLPSQQYVETYSNHKVPRKKVVKHLRIVYSPNLHIIQLTAKMQYGNISELNVIDSPDVDIFVDSNVAVVVRRIYSRKMKLDYESTVECGCGCGLTYPQASTLRCRGDGCCGRGSDTLFCYVNRLCKPLSWQCNLCDPQT
jgi:hypothetical protein